MPHFEGKTNLVSLLVVVCILLVTVIGCAGPQGPQGQPGPAGPPGPASAASQAVLVAPTSVVGTARDLVCYVSGFKPNERVLVKLKGTWKMDNFNVTDIALGSAVTNKDGSAKINSFANFANAVSVCKIQAGVYSLIAEQGNITVTAPVEITAPPPPATPKPTATPTPK